MGIIIEVICNKNYHRKVFAGIITSIRLKQETTRKSILKVTCSKTVGNSSEIYKSNYFTYENFERFYLFTLGYKKDLMDINSTFRFVRVTGFS